MSSILTSARYGKEKVRVFRVVRQGDRHEVAEYNITVLLEGDIETSYTKADNSVVVATDSMKNTCYVLAKTSPHVLSPELFALQLGHHFVTKYPHIHKTFISLEKLRWSRIAGKTGEHPHSFMRDGDEKEIVEVEVDASSGPNKVISHVKSGLKGLLVLKSSGSAFESFIRDEFTTLPEVSDRIFSTEIDLVYEFSTLPENIGVGGLDKLEKEMSFRETAVKARDITLEVFATDNSESVQATLFKTAQALIAASPTVSTVSYKLPNKHYIPVDLSYIGLENVKPPEKAEVFCPVAAPSGLITATVSRST